MEISLVNLKTGFGTVGKNGQYKDIKEWIDASEKHVYIGRFAKFWIPRVPGGLYILHSSKYCNPFKLSDHSIDDAIEKYKKYLISKPELIKQATLELQGKTLGCWCKGKNKCHGEIIIELIEKYKRDPNKLV